MFETVSCGLPFHKMQYIFLLFSHIDPNISTWCNARVWYVNNLLFSEYIIVEQSILLAIYVPNVTVIYLYLRWSCSHIRALFAFAAWPFLVCIGYDGRRDKHTWAMVPDKATSPKWEWVLRNMKVWWRSLVANILDFHSRATIQQWEASFESCSGYCKAFAKAWFVGSLSWFWLGTQHTGKEDLKSGQRSCGNESFPGYLQTAHKWTFVKAFDGSPGRPSELKRNECASCRQDNISWWQRVLVKFCLAMYFKLFFDIKIQSTALAC